MSDPQATEERPVLSAYIEAYSKLNLVAYEQERQAREQFAADDREWLSREVERLELARLQAIHERDCAVEDVARLKHRLERIEQLAAHDVTGCRACVAILEEIAHERRAGDVPAGCTRSHPHEEMNAECERLTQVARSGAKGRNERGS